MALVLWIGLGVHLALFRPGNLPQGPSATPPPVQDLLSLTSRGCRSFSLSHPGWGSLSPLALFPPSPAATPTGITEIAPAPSPGQDFPDLLYEGQIDQLGDSKDPGTPVAPAKSGPAPTWARWSGHLDLGQLNLLIQKYAALHRVDAKLIWALVRQESGFNPGAVSPKGAMGLMQLMPGTAALMGVTAPFDAEQNIAGGVKYLKLCLEQFNQDVSLALAAYNAGPENVNKYHGCPPFAETQNYVLAVLRDCAVEIRPQGPRNASKVAADAESAPAIKRAGLQWKVPAPHWNISEPHLKVQAPRWKGKG